MPMLGVHKTRKADAPDGPPLRFALAEEIEMQCPKCNSTNIDKKNYGKRAGTVVGAGAGAVAGWGGAAAGAKAGAAIGAFAGPIGAAAGGIFGSITGALLGGTAGGVIGSKAGEVVDENVLDNYRCLKCDFEFSK